MEEFMPMAIEFAKNHSLIVVAWVAISNGYLPLHQISHQQNKSD